MSNKRPKCKNDELIVSFPKYGTFPTKQRNEWGRKKNLIKNGTRLLNRKEPFPGSATARVTALCKTQKRNFSLPLATLPKAVLLTSKFRTSVMPVRQMTSQ